MFRVLCSSLKTCRSEYAEKQKILNKLSRNPGISNLSSQALRSAAEVKQETHSRITQETCRQQFDFKYIPSLLLFMWFLTCGWTKQNSFILRTVMEYFSWFICETTPNNSMNNYAFADITTFSLTEIRHCFFS